MAGEAADPETAEAPRVETLAKATADDAGTVAGRCQLSSGALGLLGDGATAPGPFLDTLIRQDCPGDALTFLAHALPPREGTWWACQAARTLPLGDDAALPRRTVRAAEAWVFHPDDGRRRDAMALAEELGFDSPASWAAVAAFWSGDSLAPPDQPKVPPKAYLWCHAVNGAVQLAAADGPADRITARRHGILRLGIDIANGGTGRPRSASQSG